MKTKVIIIEDNALIQAAYKKAIATLPDIEIVGIASDGKQGFELLIATDPDVVICDLNMPVMDGFEFTKKAMAEKPKPILIISDLVQKEDEGNIFKVLQLGAIDVLPKPRFGGDINLIAQELSRKIKVLKGVIVFRKTQKNSTSTTESLPSTSNQGTALKVEPSLPSPGFVRKNFQIVAIGASTGGPQAFQAVLETLPGDFPLPIVCVQHISPGFSESLVEWLSHNCKIKVQFAEEGKKPIPGIAYFPKDDHHLCIRNGVFHLNTDDLVRGHRPSVDYLFHSVAKEYGDLSLSVVMTGMGDDGARGLKEIKDKGSYTISQDESSSIVYGMPRVAYEMGASMEVLSLESIGPRILALVKAKS